MNRNQKVALGCGGAGCLGLIVVVIAAGLIYFFTWRSPGRSRSYNYNVSTNRNSNSNDNSDFTANKNDDSPNSNSSSSSSSSASTLSDDDKHKLYQAAGMTGDAELIRRVSVKIGLMDEDYTPGAGYEKFIEEHVSWTLQNTAFIQSVNTAEKARAYIQTHLPD